MTADGTTEAETLFAIGASGARLLDAVRRIGPVARSGLPGPTFLSQQSVHRLTEDLLSRGLLQAEAPRIAGRGKPSPRLALRPDGAYGLGLAIDTDSARIAVTNLAGEILCHDSLEAPPDDPDAVCAEARRAFHALTEQQQLPAARIAGLGVSVQGFRQARSTAFITPEPLARWTNLDIGQLFTGLITAGGRPLPAMAENNANLGAVAELWSGAGRDHDSFAYLSFNLGFGGGVVLDGALWRGHHLNAAEVSSLYAAEEFDRRPTLGLLLTMLCEDGLQIDSVRGLCAAYDPAWPTLDRWIERVTPALNQMVRALTGILDPAAIVFGGEAPLDLRQRLVAAVDPRAPDRIGRPIPAPEILASAIETDPSVLGAALLPIRMRLFA